MAHFEMLDMDERPLSERLAPISDTPENNPHTVIYWSPAEAREAAWNRRLASLTPIERRHAIKGRRAMRPYAHAACHWPKPKTYPRAK